MRTLLVALVGCALPVHAQSETSKPAPASAPSRNAIETPRLRGLGNVDGIDLGRVDGFWNDWHLVTVRYRKDIGEQRFIYANDIAWRALREGKSSYPDGGMLAKIAYATVEDAAFPNSAEPRRFTRIQLMRKDRRAYGSTNGWGYALVVAGAQPVPDSGRTGARTCHACHLAVPDRDYVFSKATFLNAAPSATATFKSRFRDQSPSSLSEYQRAALHHVLRREPLTTLGVIRGSSMALFDGSVNESIAVLDRYAAEDGRVYALWDDAKRHFAIARPLPATPECRTRSWMAVSGSSSLSTKDVPVRVGIMCNGIWQNSARV